jgi:hypothetical protein
VRRVDFIDSGILGEGKNRGVLFSDLFLNQNLPKVTDLKLYAFMQRKLYIKAGKHFTTF